MYSHFEEERELQILICEFCGREEEVDPVTGIDENGDQKFWFPNLPVEVAVCKRCYQTRL